MSSAMSTMLARCGSGVLVEDGDRWVFAHQSGSGGNVVLFVLGLFGVILEGNGVMMAATGGDVLVAGLVMLAIGSACIGLLVLVHNRRRAARRNTTLSPIVTLDFTNGVLLDHRGAVLAPLAHVTFATTMQLASSARALECRWGPGKALVVLRGDAFGGRIGPAIDALRRKGFRV